MGREVAVTYDGTKGEDCWLPCSRCNVYTSHKVLASVEIEDRAVDGDELVFMSWDDFQIVQCQGCKTTSFRKINRNIEEYEWDEAAQQNVLIEHQELYPSRVAGRQQLRGCFWLPSGVSEVYRETHSALSNNLRILAGIGIRALVEAVCKERKAEGNNLADRINDLVTQGILTKDGAEILHSLRIMGNEAAHEVKPHSERDLMAAFDVIEHLLNGVYILPRVASRLPKRRGAA